MANRFARRGLGCTLVVLCCVALNCRRLTAEPGNAPSAIPAGPFQVSESIYDGGLKPGWQDWGWGAHDLSRGAARLNMSSYGGWILHHDASETRYGALVFRVQAPASFGSFLRVQLANGQGDQSFPGVAIGPERLRPASSGWLEVYLPWSDLNPALLAFDRIVIHAKSLVGPDFVLLDKVGLTRFDPKTAPAIGASVPVKSVSLVVNCRAPSRVISPYIYGVAGDVWELGPTARRWGGNPTTRYNWQIGNVFNVGKDWFFENQKSATYQAFLGDNATHHVSSALTVPMIGWVAKDDASVGFPISVLGAQKAKDPYRSDAGNGVKLDGSLLSPGNPSQTSLPAPPEMIQKWVETIRRQDQKTGVRSVQMYILDNEPNLWNANHRDVHPDPLTYDELFERTVRYSSVVRAADPQALIAGPAEWGWTGYLYSAKDTAAGVRVRSDRLAHGDVPLVPWYLKQLHDHDVQMHTRSLDVLDLHYYPQEANVYSDAGDGATAALRLRSTRSLWDPDYQDESWIKDTIRLIPRMREWIDQNYPGLAISIGEYNFGGEKHMSGGLALAEALGRFGSEGVGYAYYWLAPPKGSPAYWAFRAYRNFDGKGGHFLERSIPTTMTPGVSLFASKDESGRHLVLVALNLEPNSVAQAKIDLAGCAAIESRRRFTYSSLASSPSDDGVSSSASFDERLPPYSISVFDVVLK